MNSTLRFIKRQAEYALQLGRDIPVHLSENKNLVEATRAVLEQHKLLRTSAIDAIDYYQYALNRKDRPFSEKASFIGSYKPTRYYRYLNPTVFDILARDKELFHIYCRSIGIPTPKVLATTGRTRAPALAPNLPSFTAIRDFFAHTRPTNIFVKPADGHFGEGALSLGLIQKTDVYIWNRLPTHEPITLDEIIRHFGTGETPDRFLIQERLQPHAEMDAIVPNVCPTARIITLNMDRPIIVGAALRLGNGMSPTDNLTGGGIAVGIDDRSGEILLGTHYDGNKPIQTASHPLLRTTFAGRTMPYWSDIRALVERSAAQLPFFRLIAWDVAITPDAPTIIEINTHPGLRAIQGTAQHGLLAGPLAVALAPYPGALHSGIQARSSPPSVSIRP